MKQKRFFYFDVETTGLDPVDNDIIQMAVMIVIDGKLEMEFEQKCQPFDFDNVTDGAIKTHGLSIAQMKSFPKPGVLYDKLDKVFEAYRSKKHFLNKFCPAGYNVHFDMEFLKNFFIKNNDNKLMDNFNNSILDPHPVLTYLGHMGAVNLHNSQLKTACKHFNIPLQAHDALSDLRATRMLNKVIYAKYFKNFKKEQ